MNHQAIILMGLPASGKTTLRQKMYPVSAGFVHLSTDDIVEEYAAHLGKSYAEVWPDYIGKATGIMNSHMRDAIKVKRNIVIDRTLMTAKSRGKYIRQLKVAGYTVRLIHMDTDIDEVFRRLDVRAAETGKTIPRRVVADMTTKFEDPRHVNSDGNFIEDWDTFTVYMNGDFKGTLEK